MAIHVERDVALRLWALTSDDGKHVAYVEHPTWSRDKGLQQIFLTDKAVVALLESSKNFVKK